MSSCNCSSQVQYVRAGPQQHLWVGWSHGTAPGMLARASQLLVRRGTVGSWPRRIPDAHSSDATWRTHTILQSLPPLQCAVLISGSRIRDPTWAGVYGGPSTSNGGTAMTDLHPESAQALLQRPTCHLIGAADPMRGRSEQLALCFQSPLVLQHEQGKQQ